MDEKNKIILSYQQKLENSEQDLKELRSEIDTKNSHNDQLLKQ